MNRRMHVALVAVLAIAFSLTLPRCQRSTPKSDDELAKQKEQAVTTKGVKPVTPPTVADVPPAASDPLAAAFPAGPSALDNVEALKYLPPEVSIVVVAQDPAGLLDRLGREELTRSFAKYYEMAVAEVVQTIGENVLVPKNLTNVGIDPAAPVGFAMLQFNRPVGVLFWSLSDPDRFKTTIYSVAGRVREKMEPHVVGSATVICPRNDEEVCFIIKDKMAFLHMADLSDEEALAKAMEFAARTTEAPNLAGNELFAKTTKALGFGKDAALYLNTPALMDGILNIDNNWAEESLKSSEEQLAKAKESKVESEIQYWTDRVGSDREWAERQRKRKAAQKEMFESLLGGAGTMAMGVELTPKSLRFKSYTYISEDSPWLNLARPLGKSSPILDYTSQNPFYLAHLNIDLKSYLKVLEMAFASEGLTMAEVSGEFNKFTGLSLEADFLDVLTGEIGLAVYGDVAAMMSGDMEGPKAMGGNVLLGLTSQEKAKASLGRLFALDMVKPFVQQADENTWVIPVPEWRSVTVAIVGDQLALTTDPEFLAALKSGTRQSFVDRLDNPDVNAMLGVENSLGIAAMDFGSFSMLFFGMARVHSDMAMPEQVAEKYGEDIAYSEEYKAIKKEKEELRAAIQKERQAIEKETNERIAALLQRIGITAAVGMKKGNEFYGYGGHFIADESIPKLIENSVKEAIALEELDSTRRREVWQKEDKVWELDKRMQEVRSETLRKAEEEKFQKEQEKLRMQLKLETGQQPPDPADAAPGSVVVETYSDK